MIPHPAIPVLDIRPADMALLLGMGATLEVLSRGVAHLVGCKSEKEIALETELTSLNLQTAKSRRKGQSAFVETSKLERQILNAEKSLSSHQANRQGRVEKISKVIRTASLSLYLLVFVLYFGISMLSFDGMKIDSQDLESTAESRARSFHQGLLFPISYIGMGIKIARLGIQQVGIGALVVLWSAQVTVGKVIDCVEALQ
jgi:hypothetical protein